MKRTVIPGSPVDSEQRYGFGQNWAEYIDKNFDETKVATSQRHLLDFLKLVDLSGKSFLDIGCGSGLHSLAAFRAGASEIVSFDYDPNSVATTQKLHERAGSPANWTVRQGSVLDTALMSSLGTFDVVYSWGVLHHTGDMWAAIENAALPMRADGVFCIALYTRDVHIKPTPEFWLGAKKMYNRTGSLGKRCMEWAYALCFTVLPTLARLRNPLRWIAQYERSRGMAYWTDVRDWLGGWPMEFAGIAETKQFCGERLGLELLNVSAGEANTEYLLRKRGAKNYWDDYAAGLSFVELTGPFVAAQGHAWTASLPAYLVAVNRNPGGTSQRLMLHENDVPFGFEGAPPSHIRAHGGSRYCAIDGDLLFSTSDNSNPNTNGRSYTVALYPAA